MNIFWQVRNIQKTILTRLGAQVMNEKDFLILKGICRVHQKFKTVGTFVLSLRKAYFL